MAEQLFDSQDCLFNGFTEAQLSAAFDAVSAPTHWKDPIESVIAEHHYPLTAAAVEFYTATKLSFVTLPTGRLAVTAPGYRAGPAGDH